MPCYADQRRNPLLTYSVGIFSPFEDLSAALEHPYEDRPGCERYTARPEHPYQIFCGT